MVSIVANPDAYSGLTTLRWDIENAGFYSRQSGCVFRIKGCVRVYRYVKAVGCGAGVLVCVG